MHLIRFLIKKVSVISLCLTSCLLLNAQADTLPLTYEAYIDQIIHHHPIARQANLKTRLGEAKWLSAKGNFDPVLTSNWEQKRFDNKNYYSLFQSQLSIPTPLGVNLVAGYENNGGVFLNPENKTDEYGLWNIGIEANLLQGFITDKRRTTLQQAAVFQLMAENERQILLNKLLYEASTIYLYWQQQHQIQLILQNGINLAENYFENTKTAFFQGEKPAIDTLEAFLVLQDRNAAFLSLSNALVKTTQLLENYLWQDDLPATLVPGIVPQSSETTILNPPSYQDTINVMQRNPGLQLQSNKQQFYQLEQRYRRDLLKPTLKFKYNPLLATEGGIWNPVYTVSDYKWGVNFSVPLFLRTERANIQANEVQLQEIALDIQNKRNQLRNAIEASLLQQQLLQSQIRLQEQNIDLYRQLLEAENEKFQYGESSVFLINKRQEKYLEAQIKRIELNTYLQLRILEYWYTTNQLL